MTLADTKQQLTQKFWQNFYIFLVVLCDIQKHYLLPSTQPLEKHRNSFFIFLPHLTHLCEFHLTNEWKKCANISSRGFILILEKRGKGSRLARATRHTATLIPDLRHQPTTSLTHDPSVTPLATLCHRYLYLTVQVKYVFHCEQQTGHKFRARQERQTEKDVRQRSRDGKQFQHGDWSLIKCNVTVLLDFPSTTHCKLLSFHDKIITNSSVQHFPHTHTHTSMPLFKHVFYLVCVKISFSEGISN